MKMVVLMLALFSVPAGAMPQTRDFKKLKIEDDQKLIMFLNSFLDAVEEHRWNDVMNYFDETNYQIQHEAGIEQPQYIEEGLGMGMADNHLVDRPKDQSDFHRLNGIVTITLEKVVRSGNSTTATGKVKLFDKTFRKITLYLTRKEGGDYIITPAVG